MKLSNIIKNLTVTGAALTLCGVALAQPSNPSQARGYAKCLDAAAQQSTDLRTQRRYLFSRDGGSSQYYINGSRSVDGNRSAVRIHCQTTANGHQLVSQEIASGRFTRRHSEPTVRIADR